MGDIFDCWVGNIGWAQDSIRGTFQDGRDVQDAINALRTLTHDQRRAIVATYDRIRVVDFNEQGYITLDNRRLYIFRAVLLPNTPISVRFATSEEAKELKRKLTTTDEGATIVVRS